MNRRIGVLTSGGDCPGLNAVIRAVVCAAAGRGWQVVGFRDGYEGLLLPGHYRLLTPENTAHLLGHGGTVLGTTNRGHFVARPGGHGKGRGQAEIFERVIRTLAELEVDGLVCVGGDGSLNTAQQLHGAGVHVVGVPKTIDNDLEATAVTFGFDSAVGCVAEALDRLRTTSDSHKRAMVVEVMGRHAGWIALYGGMAGGADVILIPEIPFTVEAVANAIRQRDAHGETGSLIVVAEGARCRGGREYARRTGSGEYRLGGIAETVARSLHQASGKEVRTMVLGHLQRGGSPSAQDRILGTRFGVKAVELLAEGTYGHMVNVREDRVGSVPLITAVRKMKAVPRNCDVVAAARCVGIRFGDEAESLG